MAMDRRTLVGVLVTLLVAGAVGPGAGLGAVDGERGLAGQQETPTNETVRHEDPGTVDRSGDLDAVEGWLADRLNERLGESTVAISEGEYERARSVLGDEYDEQLGRYVEVAGETDREEDDEAAESFRDARNRTRSFADRTDRFNETEREYEQATERGDSERARELARALIDQAEATNETARRLEGDLERVGNRSGADVEESVVAVESVSRNVTARAEAVAEATFTRTRLSANATPATVSFREPATVSGRLVEENGTALGNRTVLVGHPDEAVRAETNATGWFEATYRPARLPVRSAGVPVRYVPEDGAAYLGNETIAPADVRQVEPDVTASVEGSPARYGDRVAVRGAITVDDVGVGHVPLVVSIGGTTIGRLNTSATGAFMVNERLPASVPAGEQRVTVRVDQSERAVTSTSESVRLTVESTETDLSVDASLAVNGTLSAAGRLQTVEGRAVGGQPIDLLVDGTAVATTRTDGDGRFSVAVPPTAHGIDTNGTVRFRFYPRGNLLGSTETATVGSPPAEEGGFELPVPGWVMALLVGGLVVAVGGVIWRWLGAGADVDDGVAPGEPEVNVERAAPEPAWRDDVDALLARGDTDRAVTVAYGAARRRLAEELGLPGAATHWEVYTACAEDGLGEGRVEAVRGLTEAYERAQFAPATLSAADAEAAIERAAAVLEG